MSDPPKVVYDCMVFLQAAARPDREHSTMRLVREDRVVLYVSPVIVGELWDVLTRPELRTRFPALKPRHVDMFLADVLSRAIMIQDVPPSFSLPRDKKDEPYINLAIKANIRFLVTWNYRHLTYLMRRDTAEGDDFCRRFPNIQIVDPPTFAREVQSAL